MYYCCRMSACPVLKMSYSKKGSISWLKHYCSKQYYHNVRFLLYYYYLWVYNYAGVVSFIDFCYPFQTLWLTISNRLDFDIKCTVPRLFTNCVVHTILEINVFYWYCWFNTSVVGLLVSAGIITSVVNMSVLVVMTTTLTCFLFDIFLLTVP